MIDPQHAMKKFPSYARKVRIRSIGSSRRRVFNINRIAPPRIAFLDLRVGSFAAIMNQEKTRVPTRSTRIIREISSVTS